MLCIADKRGLSERGVVRFNLTQHHIRISLRSAGPCATYEGLSDLGGFRSPRAATGDSLIACLRPLDKRPERLKI